MSPGEYGWTLVFRVAVTLGFLWLLWRNGAATRQQNTYMRQLLDQGQRDHAAREKALDTLRESAVLMAKQLADELIVRESTLAGRFDDVDKKLDNNTKLTIAAADASQLAVKTANDVNRKIADTNQRQIEQADRAAEDVQGLHAHLDQDRGPMPDPRLAVLQSIETNTAETADALKRQTKD